MMTAQAFKAADAFARQFEGTAMRPHEAFRATIEILCCVTLATVQEYQTEELAQEFDEAMRAFERCGVKREQALHLAKDFMEAMASDGGDRLGDMAARLGTLYSGMGQFFTPTCVSKLLAQITLPDEGTIRGHIERNGFIRSMDPAAGSGGLLIALAQRVRDAGFDPRFKLFVEATEKDPAAWRMCYVQLSAYDIPARVVLGDSLTLEQTRAAYTPAYFRFFKPRRDLDVLLSLGQVPGDEMMVAAE
jgi:type I restriction-modification system DNA methylase subunit